MRPTAPDVLRELAGRMRERRPVALVTVLASPGGRAKPGTKLLVPEDSAAPPFGTTGDEDLDRELVGHARECLANGAIRRTEVAGVDAFFQSFVPPPTLYVIGAVHPAAELAAAAKLAGYRVVVCDPRSPFATPERLPAADLIVREWPDAYLGSIGLSRRDAVAVLTHDLKFDVPALRSAIRGGAGYVGAMGSRKTHERRVARLRDEGLADEDLGRIAAPIGLDIGAETPGEVAVAIVAQIIERRRLPRGRKRDATAGRSAPPG